MGEASKRGTFEERKAAAIERDKKDEKSKTLERLSRSGNKVGVIGAGHAGKSILLGMAAAMGGPMDRGAGPFNSTFHDAPRNKGIAVRTKKK